MNKTEATQFIKTFASYESQRAAEKGMAIPRRTLVRRFNQARDVLGGKATNELMRNVKASMIPAGTSGGAGGEAPAPKEKVNPTEALVKNLVEKNEPALRETMLEDELKRLRAHTKALAERVLSDEMVTRHIFEIAHSKPTIPDWIVGGVPSQEDSVPGVPILFGSDWHWGEVVKPSEIGGVNEYNLEIARARLMRLIETTVDLLTNHMVNPQYPGIVFALGGDMVSGDIHEELSVTNDMPMMPVVLDLVDHLYIAIKRLKEVFGKVFLPCVAGNHGRNTHKVRAKEFNYNSFDWLIYKQLDRLFQEDPDVVFYIPDGTDALVNIAGHRYCFTHGNSFKTGDSMIGPLGPVVRGDHRKRGRNGQVGHEYDTLVLGHFHQLVQMKRIIMNGSLIGYNEYAYTNNFGYEPPQQALWLSHPLHGITFSMPVNVGEDFGRKKRRELDGRSNQPWVSFHDAKKAA